MKDDITKRNAKYSHVEADLIHDADQDVPIDVQNELGAKTIGRVNRQVEPYRRRVVEELRGQSPHD